MAVSLTITVTNAQAARVAVAFGHVESPTDPTWVNGTVQEVTKWILAQVRRKTLDYEATQARILDQATREAEVW